MDLKIRLLGVNNLKVFVIKLGFAEKFFWQV